MRASWIIVNSLIKFKKSQFYEFALIYQIVIMKCQQILVSLNLFYIWNRYWWMNETKK
jgi:hypothetical protein